jgi:iron complex outermembrane receptor protein
MSMSLLAMGKAAREASFELAVAATARKNQALLAGLTLKASMQNITNKETLTCYDATNCWIGRDRTYQLGASYSF